MNAKDFLIRGVNLERRVETFREEIEHYKTMLNKCSVTYSDSPKSTAPSYRLENCTQKIMDLQTVMCDAMADLVEVSCEISRAIQMVENYDYQDLLVKRYILGENWEKISSDLGYELRYIHKLHGKALREIKICSQGH